MDGGNHLEILNFLFQSGDVVPVLQYLFDTAKQMMELDVSGFPSKYGTLPYHEDFSHYKSGLYKHITGGMMGGHAVKLIGWGTNDAGEDYWLLANQWNRGWGDDGYFKITRGNNECGIKEDVVAGLPLTKNMVKSYGSAFGTAVV